MFRSLLLCLGIVGLVGAGSASCSESHEPPVPDSAGPRPEPTRCTSFSGRPGIAQARVAAEHGFLAPVQVVRDAARGFVYVVELAGTIRRYREGDPAPPELALDISSSITLGGEEGLLGMALESVGDVTTAIVKFVGPPLPGSDAVVRTIVARFTSTDGGRTFDPASMREILSIDQPGRNHRGGPPAFGPDGMLYIPTGDGGFDTKRSSQDLGLLLGKILRIDTRSGAVPYAIPADNPFVGVPGARPELFALGFRNPFGWSFDPDASSVTLWVGDVGESRREELNRVERGKNYGWPIFEGDLCAEGPCESPDLEPPAYTYENNGSNAVVGGPVYRGARFPELQGRVIVADNATGRVEAVSREPGRPDPVLLDESGLYILGLGEDASGEILLMDWTGKLWTFDPRASNGAIPQLLSATGCVDMASPKRAAPGLLPYDVNMPLWSDGTEKTRSLSLPAGSTLKLLDDASFEAPVGTVAVKTFFWHGRPLETRLFLRQPDGDWAGYSYEWRADGRDADLLEHGKRKDLGDLVWTYPSRSQCLACHTAAAGRTLGLDVAQLNRRADVNGGFVADQLQTWEEWGLVDTPLGDPALLPRFPARDSAPSAEWARAYLHANCSHCHRPGGPGASSAKLLATAPLAASGCDELPLGETFGIEGARFVAPGRPESSLAVHRMSVSDPFYRMPPIGTWQPDQLAISIVSDWIRSLGTCDDGP